MNRLTYDELVNIEYKFIFDYYDKPLVFIGHSNQANYLLYFIDSKRFFISRLDKRDVKKISELKNLTSFYRYLIENDNLQVLIFDYVSKQVDYYKLHEIEFDYETFLPKTNTLIDFDYFNEREIDFNYRFEDHLSFPLETEDLTIRIVDSRNSSHYKLSVISEVIKYFEQSFQSVKRNFGSSEKELMALPFTEGSFKVNLLLSNEPNLFEDYLSFEPILSILKELNVTSRELDLDKMKNKLDLNLIENVDKVYETLKKEEVSLELYSNESSTNRITKLASNPIIDNNLAVFKEKIKELQSLVVTRETETIDGEIQSASTIRNSFVLRTVNGTFSGKFSKDIIEGLRDKNITLKEFPSAITATLEIETTSNFENEETDKKYTIIGIEQ